jgi:RNA polymerase sigma-70 factor, ECF subfamily
MTPIVGAMNREPADRLTLMATALLSRERPVACEAVTTPPPVLGPNVLGPHVLGPDDLEVHRRELTAYCYRMLGSGFDADDAVQETMVRAWRASDSFEGRSSTRSWLYRIATNVCLDMLRARQRRARPMELGPSRPPVESSLEGVLPEGAWVSPIADERVLPMEADPADLAAARETIRLAFVAALQHLPARQRAVLVLCEVLRWQAAEAAELLSTSVAAVNSALQRARATLATLDTGRALAVTGTSERELLANYVDAFERYDMDKLVNLLHKDAVQSMPPFAMWLQGSADITRFMVGPGAGCRGSRLIPIEANGGPAYGHYKPSPQGGYLPWAIQVIEISRDRVSGIHSFLEADKLFPVFGLPAQLPS